MGGERARGWASRFGRAVANPLVILLTLLSLVSMGTGDPMSGTLMLAMVLLGVGVRLVQETRASGAVARLRAMCHVTATVLRDGAAREVPLREVVPGDVARLGPGDMVPGDSRILQSSHLHVAEAPLTGESVPVEKDEATEVGGEPGTTVRRNLCFLGTSVETGTALVVVIATGKDTELGRVAEGLGEEGRTTSFDAGVWRFTWLMLRFMAVMVPLVVLVNGVARGDWREAFLFGMAVAAGLTPEMLPMIVSVCLANGAIAMSRRKVIVKRLHAVQDFGAMDVLCTDKTGTLTQDRVILERYVDVEGRESMEVLHHAYVASHFHAGLRNVLDRAILAHRDVHGAMDVDRLEKIDEVPFDYLRKMGSVVVRRLDGVRQLVAKGAPASVLARCSHYAAGGGARPMEADVKAGLQERMDAMGRDGFRVLAVAIRTVEERVSYATTDEAGLVLAGYLAFLDPPKETAGRAVSALRPHGVGVKVLTGDNEMVTRKVCEAVGIDAGKVLVGHEVEAMGDEELAGAAEATGVFARLSPMAKQRVVRALQRRGHVVGFLGDGINDAPALWAADVGISVDNAVDIARECADMVLLEKSLLVLDEGVREEIGRAHV